MKYIISLPHAFFTSLLTLSLSLLLASPLQAQPETNPDIPLPEHPRPDFERPEWVNLNGSWEFRFDKEGKGVAENWFEENASYDRSIRVPFSWAAPLSGLTDDADIGWYRRTITIPETWTGKRIFLVVGAADWYTTAWLNGQELGTHRGGYTPFEFELPVSPGTTHTLVLRVDDTPHPFKLEGKQGYGPARGIWQTPYLEARGSSFLASVHFSPDIDAGTVGVIARLSEPAVTPTSFQLRFLNGHENLETEEQIFARGSNRISFEIPIPDARLWSLEDPFLYDVEAILGEAGPEQDRVRAYFGMRKISVVNLPGTEIPYIALNNQPIYLQTALDQAYHPEGYYTFPSDTFIRDEVLRSRQIGLNGMRIHVKVGLPRKLYWADRLGMLIMADVPNSWGEPDAAMRQEVEYALRQMIQRDYNHPSIFAWVPFNETWGLFTEVMEGDEQQRRYLPETQSWVVSVYELAKALDPTRLVEDNSPCCGRGHTKTDINSWHAYLPGWAWEEHLSEISENTYPGSDWNFEAGYQQNNEPNFNSEFGNVWGYEGSTGDVDWSWDYHRAVNAFRKAPKIVGWLYTEHHDVVNEWNGYWRYDRSEKYTGLDELVEGMSLRDLHAPLYIATGGDLSREATTGETVEVPLFASFMSGDTSVGSMLSLTAEWYGWNHLGEKVTYDTQSRSIAYRPYQAEPLSPLRITMPEQPGVGVLALRLADQTGRILHRNFTTFVVQGTMPANARIGQLEHRYVRFKPDTYTDASWTQKHWDVLDGRKVNGAGSGFFEYSVPWPDDFKVEQIASAALVLEASAKVLHGKDRDDQTEMDGDYMRGRGTFDPSRNPNAYPMTDEEQHPSAVALTVNGIQSGRAELPDDPADHRGILSWHAQLKDRKLREAGSYGYRLQFSIPETALEAAAASGTLKLRLSVDEALPGGLALYGAAFGRYPLDPTFIFALERP